MKKVVFSLLSIALVSSIAIAASAKDTSSSTNSGGFTPMAIYSEYEPNNTAAMASPFSGISGDQINAKLSPDGDDEDFFVFTAPKSGNFTFSITHHPQFKVYFDLLDKKGDIGDPLNGIGLYDNSFTHYLTKGEKYYLWVHGRSYTVGAEIPYSIYVN